MSREELISKLYDPFLLDGMDIAVETIEDAVMNGDKITVYGDYDAERRYRSRSFVYIP